MGYSYSTCCGSKAKQQASGVEKRSSPQTVPTVNDSRQNQNVEVIKPVQPVESFHASTQDFVKNKSTRVSDDYKIKENIGVGSYGEVKRAIDKKTGEERAAKIIQKKLINPKDYGNLMEEVKIILSLDHPNIIKVYDVYEEPHKYYIISELLKGGELFDTIVASGHLSEQRAARIMKQLLSAVAYCHKAGVAHRDLKPENILFENKFEDNVKIIDFGFAEILRPNHRLHGALGTVYYIAPEVINESEYNEKCDIWSCGVILYIMLSGYPPFHGKSGKDEEVLELVQKGHWEFDNEVWDDISEEAKDFIRRLMEIDPEKRYSGEQSLQDPWLTHYSQKSQIDRPLAKAALERLSSFRVSSKLQETIWIFLVSYFSSKQDIHKLWEAFKALDTDGDGQLTKEELTNAYIQIEGFGNHEAEEEANKILATLDADRDGKVSYSEFLAAAASRRVMLTKDHLEKAFKIFDKDGDGFITANDLRLLFNTERMQRFPNDLCQRMIEEADKSKQGKVDIKEFESMMFTLLHNNKQKESVMQSLPGQG